MRKKGFTLLETLVIVMMISILCAIAVGSYAKSREKAIDREGLSNLKLISIAEKIYNYAHDGSYYASTSISNLNENLKLSLISNSSRNWNYSATATGCAQATRNGDNGRSFRILITDDEPAGGTC